MTRIVVYQDVKQEWRWRLVAHNGRIIADSAEGYVTRGNVRRAVMRFKITMAQRPPVFWTERFDGRAVEVKQTQLGEASG